MITTQGTHPSPVSLTFLGATGTVTGSKFLLESVDGRFLVDCGMFQGTRQWWRANWEPLDLDPTTVGTVILTHAHLDHSGYLPRLVRDGFTGTVVCTPATAQLVQIVLRDAAHLQEEDAEYARRGRFSKHDPPEPLFDKADAERAIALLRPVPFDEAHRLGAHSTVTLRSAGHILGSAFAELDIEGHRITFSGDLGRDQHPVLRAPAVPSPADTVLIESTYGDRLHGEDAEEQLAEALRRTRAARGSGAAAGLRRGPHADAAAHPGQRHRERSGPGRPGPCRQPDGPRRTDRLPRGHGGRRPAVPSGGHRPRGAGDAAPDAADAEPAGVCLAQRAARTEHHHLGVGHGHRGTGAAPPQVPTAQSPQQRDPHRVPGGGTRGRTLADGAHQVKIHGRYIPVRAEVVSVDGFSAHADADELVAWLGRIPTPQTVYVVHGEPHASEALVERIEQELQYNAVNPRHGERVRVD